jgi:hypothetical protein
MSLNQITNPLSQFPIYAKTVSVPPLPTPTGFTGLITVRTPTVDPNTLNITSSVYKLGDLYTIMCRARFTATAVTPITFDVNIPGFVFATGEGEAAPVIKNGDFPNLALEANTNGMIVDGFMLETAPGSGVFVPTLRLLYSHYTTGTSSVNSVNGQPYDLSFTMNAVVNSTA